MPRAPSQPVLLALEKRRERRRQPPLVRADLPQHVIEKDQPVSPPPSCSPLHKPSSEWHEVFPGAACVVSLVDRLVHNAEVIAMDGESYRLKEATERAGQRARRRKGPSS